MVIKAAGPTVDGPPVGLPVKSTPAGAPALDPLHDLEAALDSGQLASFITHPGTGRVLCIGGGYGEEIQQTLVEAHYQVARLGYAARPTALPTAVATYLPDVVYAVVEDGDEAILSSLELLTQDRRTDGTPLIAVVNEDAPEALIDELYTRTGCDFFRVGTTSTELLARTHLLCRMSRPTKLLVPNLEEASGRPVARAANDPAPPDAFRDAATRLYTASYFEHRMPMEVARARRYDRPLAIVAARVPAAAGDEALAIKVAGLLRRSLRSPDVPARMEADLFVAMLPEADVADLTSLLDRLGQGLAEVCDFGLGVAGLDDSRESGGYTPREMVTVARMAADAILAD